MSIVDQFDARSDSGNIYTIIVSRDHIDVSTHDDPNATISGQPSAITSEGYNVNKLDDKKYQIVQTGEIVTRIE